MAFTINDLEKILADMRRRLRLLEIQGSVGIIQTGLAADRPSTPNVSTGTTVSYYAYDSKVLSIWNIDDAAWDEVTFS